MRKVLVSEMISLDGYFAGPHGDLSWHNVDDEFNALSIEQLDSVDTLLFGRVTYGFMASYWPSAEGLADDPIVAGKMNALAKIVFSTTLTHAEWQNSRIVKAQAAEEIATHKQQPGKDMLIFGSGTLVTTLAEHGLIDEYRLYVNPVALGNGTPLFAGLRERLPLQLLHAQTFRSGNVLLTYQPANKA